MAATNGHDTDSTVLIVGAGVTGLTLAHGLKKIGINSIVFERHPDISGSRDWNMGLHWGAPRLQDILPVEIWAQIQSVHVDPHQPVREKDELNFVNGQTGEKIYGIPVERFYRIRREKYRSLLAHGLDVRFGKSLESFREENDRVVARFGDGTEVTGRMLVGADGARSKLRTLLLGPELGSVNRLPFAANFVQARYTAAQMKQLLAVHPIYLGAIHPDGRFGFFGMHDVRDPADPASWTIFFYISWPATLAELDEMAGWTNAQHLAKVKSLASGWCDPWKSAAEWLSDEHPIWHMGLTDWDPGMEGHRWDNRGGKLTLIGDAAHPMTYQRGQGLNHCATDVWELVREINSFMTGEKTQKETVDAFEDEMVSRAGEEVRVCTTNSILLHDWAKFSESMLLKIGMKQR